MGIHTALQLADCDTRLVRKTFSVALERTVRELRGGSCLPLEAAAVVREQIICSRSFGQRLTYYPHMREAICSYAECAAEKLRQDDRYCRHVSVFIKTSPHAASESYYSNMGSTRLRMPRHHRQGGVGIGKHLARGPILPERRRDAGDFSTGAMAQPDLFDGGSPWRNSGQLMETLDKLNWEERGSIWFAGQGIAKLWQMKREMLSPSYTTRLADIPWVRLDGEIKD